MFHKPFLHWVLRGLNGIPVFRHTEEKTRLRENHKTFDQCIEVLKSNGTILIFAEGATIHDWEIKPIKSGPARLIWDAWQHDDLQKNLKIIPVSINYNQYKHAGKHVYIFSGEPLTQTRPEPNEHYGAWKNRLKLSIREALREISFLYNHTGKNEMTLWRSLLTNAEQFQKDSCKTIESINQIKSEIATLEFKHENLNELWMQEYFPFSNKRLQENKWKLSLLLIPTVIGFFLNYPFYKLLHIPVKKIFGKDIFFDSVFFAAFTFLFPLYWWGISWLGSEITGMNAWLLCGMIILSGMLCSYGLQHFASLYNYYRLSSANRKQLQQLWINNQKIN